MSESTERWLVDATGWRGVAREAQVHQLVKETEQTFTIREENFRLSGGRTWSNRPRRVTKGAYMAPANSEAEAQRMAEAYNAAYASFEERIRALQNELQSAKAERNAACLKAPSKATERDHG